MSVKEANTQTASTNVQMLWTVEESCLHLNVPTFLFLWTIRFIVVVVVIQTPSNHHLSEFTFGEAGLFFSRMILKHNTGSSRESSPLCSYDHIKDKVVTTTWRCDKCTTESERNQTNVWITCSSIKAIEFCKEKPVWHEVRFGRVPKWPLCLMTVFKAHVCCFLGSGVHKLSRRQR